MSIIYQWPAGVPKEFMKNGYDDGIADNRLRSPMDIGPGKKRRRSTWTPREVSGSIIMTKDQVATFEAWFNDTLAGGVYNFQLEHPRTGELLTWDMQNTPKPKPYMGEEWLVPVELREVPS